MPDAAETIQFENMVRLPIHAIAVFVWRNIWLGTVRPNIGCFSCGRWRRCRDVRRKYSARLFDLMVSAVMVVMMQMDVVVVAIVWMHCVSSQL